MCDNMDQRRNRIKSITGHDTALHIEGRDSGASDI